MEKLMFTTTLNEMSSIRFGFGQLGYRRTFKSRYSRETAEAMLNYIPVHERSKFLLASGKHNLVFICIIESWNDTVWEWLESAKRFAKGQELRRQAENMELYGTKKAPELLPVVENIQDELPF
jgi:hypothetical protein